MTPNKRTIPTLCLCICIAFKPVPPAPFDLPVSSLFSCRYTYGETFGRWRTVDLLIGLSYLCRKDTDEHPVADIARHGTVYALEATGAEREAALAKLHRIERFFKYCSGLRERRPVFQRRYIVEVLGIDDQDILMQELRAGVLKPSYILTRDVSLNAIVLAVRGTHSFKDAFTSLTGASKPHHMVDSNGVVLGYSHFGMLAAARWLKTQVAGPLEDALLANPGFKLYIVGHSLGGGTAAMLTMMLREGGGIFSDATCTAIACPACMTLELAKSCKEYVTTVIHCADVIPTISPGSADALRAEVARSSWGSDFKADLRSSRIVQAVESGIRGVSSATATATSWTASRISTCYQRRSLLPLRNRPPSAGMALGGTGTLKRRNSDGDLAESEGGAGSNAARLRRGITISDTTTGDGGGSCGGGGGPNIGCGAIQENNNNTTGHDKSSKDDVDGKSKKSAVRLKIERGATGSLSALFRAVGGSVGGSGAGVSGAGHRSRSPRPLARHSEPALPTSWSPPSALETHMAQKHMMQDIDNNTAAAAAAAGTSTPVQIESMDVEYGTTITTASGTTQKQITSSSFLGQSHGQSLHLSLEDEMMEIFEGDPDSTLNDEGVGRLGLGSRNNSLEAEASVRLREVAEAVNAAEIEEAAAVAAGTSDDATVPSIIRPGGYGKDINTSGGNNQSTRQSSGKGGDIAWRRMMYPAGRIMHLVPARLVPGLNWEEHTISNTTDGKLGASSISSSQKDMATIGGGRSSSAAHVGAAMRAGYIQENEEWPEALMEEGEDYPVSPRILPLPSNNINRTATGLGGVGPPAHYRHVSELSLKDIMTEEEAAGSAAAGSTANHGPLPPLKPAIGPPPEAMVLLDEVPQEAYGRIKLCRTVLSDHVIPNYLRSLSSFMDRL